MFVFVAHKLTKRVFIHAFNSITYVTTKYLTGVSVCMCVTVRDGVGVAYYCSCF